jgi:hypothetical protein
MFNKKHNVSLFMLLPRKSEAKFIQVQFVEVFGHNFLRLEVSITMFTLQPSFKPPLLKEGEGQ